MGPSSNCLIRPSCEILSLHLTPAINVLYYNVSKITYAVDIMSELNMMEKKLENDQVYSVSKLQKTYFGIFKYISILGTISPQPQFFFKNKTSVDS